MCRCCLPNSRDITRSMRNFIQHAGEKSCMCELHGEADRSSRRVLPRKCKDTSAWSCCGTGRASSDAPASMRRPTTARQRAAWHTMGDKYMPPASHQPLTAIPASIRRSSYLSRRRPVNSAACAPRYTAAQPCRPSLLHARQPRFG